MQQVRPRRAAVEARSIDYVPLAERHGQSRSLWPVWFTGSTHLSTMAAGTIGISLGGGLFWSMIAILAGCAVGTLIVALHSPQGPKLGLPQLIQSRSQFGYYGAMLVYVVALISYVGYNAFGQILAGQTLHTLTGVPSVAGALGYSLAAMMIAIVGFRFFQKAQRWLAYVLIAGLGLYSLGLVASGQMLALAQRHDLFHIAPFAVQFSAAAAYQLSWAIYVSDYSRFLPRSVDPRSAYWWTFGGTFLGGSWGMLIGAVTAALVPGVAMSQGLVQSGDLILPGFGRLLLVLAMLGLTSGGALNIYGASLTLLSIVDTVKPITPSLGKRILAMLAVSGASVAIALTASKDFIAGFSAFLSLLLHLVVPWIAVTLVDFYLVRRGRYAITALLKPSSFYGDWNWRGIAAYGLGFAAMLPFLDTAFYVGPIARALGGIDVGMLIGIMVSALSYRRLCRSQNMVAEWRQIKYLDRDLETLSADNCDSPSPSRRNAMGG